MTAAAAAAGAKLRRAIDGNSVSGTDAVTERTRERGKYLKK